MHLFSAIRISDDLLNDKNYYFEEFLTIRQLVEESEHLSNHLFLLDEIFEKTNTIEQIATGKNLLSFLAKASTRIVFVFLNDVESIETWDNQYDLYHFAEIIPDGRIGFDHKLKKSVL